MQGLGFIQSPADSPVHVPAGLACTVVINSSSVGGSQARLAGSLLRQDPLPFPGVLPKE